MYLLIQIIVLGTLAYFVFQAVRYLITERFSSTRTCSRCEGKGWWQNTRNRERCEWCQGSGRVPKDFPL